MRTFDDDSPKRQVFINFYLADKEFFLPDQVRSALDFIHKLIKKDKKSKTLAINITNSWFKKKTGIEYGYDFLLKKYNTRMAYIKNATEKYHEWCIEKREIAAGIKTLCACGCGEEVKKGNKFIHGHHRRVLTQDQKNKNAEIMREAKNKKNRKIIKFKSYKTYKNSYNT